MEAARCQAGLLDEAPEVLIGILEPVHICWREGHQQLEGRCMEMRLCPPGAVRYYAPPADSILGQAVRMDCSRLTEDDQTIETVGQTEEKSHEAVHRL